MVGASLFKRGARADNRQVKRSRLIMVITVTVAVSLVCSSCGSKKSADAPRSDINFTVRTAVTDTLARDASLRAGEVAMIQSVKSGALQLDAGLDSLVDNNKALMSLIGMVSKGSRPASAELADARDTMADYLRDRVHQLEASLVAMTPQDLETMYARGAGTPSLERAKVIGLLLKYDPQLKSAVPSQ
jgi:hypothetical protein